MQLTSFPDLVVVRMLGYRTFTPVLAGFAVMAASVATAQEWERHREGDVVTLSIRAALQSDIQYLIDWEVKTGGPLPPGESAAPTGAGDYSLTPGSTSTCPGSLDELRLPTNDEDDKKAICNRALPGQNWFEADEITITGAASGTARFCAFSISCSAILGKGLRIGEIRITDDDEEEGVEAFEVQLTRAGSINDPNRGVLAQPIKRILIEASDAPSPPRRPPPPPPPSPVLSISEAVPVAEGATAVFTVTRSGATGASASVQWLTATDTRSGATAADGSDYTAVTTKQTLHFAAGETRKTVSVQTVRDKLDEPDETFLVRLSDASGAGITRGQAVGVIEDDDLPPTLSIMDAPPVAEGATAVFTVTRSGATGASASVQWLTATDTRSGATAADGSDYTAVTTKQTLHFAAGETRKTVSVQTVRDKLDEPDETFLVRLSDASGAGINRSQAVGTIQDADLPPTLSIMDAPPVAEGATSTFTVRLSAPSGRTVAAGWKSAPGTATEDEDYVGAKGTVTFAAGETTRTIRAVTIDDNELEGKEFFSIVLSDLVNATHNDATAVGTIMDDDREAAVVRVKRVNQTIFPQVGSALMRRGLDRVTRCIDVAVSGEASRGLAGLTEMLAGYAAAQDTGTKQSRWKALSGERLAIAAGDNGDPSDPGTASLCAAGDWRRLTDQGPVTWNGDLYGAHLGGNLRLERGFLIGMDVSHDRGDFDWRDRAGWGRGHWHLRLTGVQPYAAWLSADDTRFWAMARYGSGTVAITEGTHLSQSAKVDQMGAAFGASLLLETGLDGIGGFSARLRGEGWLGRSRVADNRDLVREVSARTEGVRGLLEGEWRDALGTGLMPTVQVGLQHDDGAGGLGLEGGAGLRWGDRPRGLSATIDSRVLLAEGSVREWGAAADVRFQRRGGIGPLLHLSLSRGDVADRTMDLWKQGLQQEGSVMSSPSINAEVGWSLGPAADARTFYAGHALTGDLRRSRVGVRGTVGRRLRLTVEGGLRETAGPTEYGVSLAASLTLGSGGGRTVGNGRRFPEQVAQPEPVARAALPAPERPQSVSAAATVLQPEQAAQPEPVAQTPHPTLEKPLSVTVVAPASPPVQSTAPAPGGLNEAPSAVADRERSIAFERRYRIQLGAYSTASRATTAQAQAVRGLSAFPGGNEHAVIVVGPGEDGLWRTLLAASFGERAEADVLCAALKERRMDCYVSSASLVEIGHSR